MSRRKKRWNANEASKTPPSVLITEGAYRGILRWALEHLDPQAPEFLSKLETYVSVFIDEAIWEKLELFPEQLPF